MANVAEGCTLCYRAGSRVAKMLGHILCEDMAVVGGKTYKGTILTVAYTAYESWVEGLPETARPRRPAPVN